MDFACVPAWTYPTGGMVATLDDNVATGVNDGAVGPDVPGVASVDWRRPYDRRGALLAAIVFGLSLGLLIVAARLDPDPAGVGTHEQLGIAPCGFLQRTGMACATCGMTTAFALAADGRIVDSFLAQPAGALLALLTAIVVVVSGYAVFAGISLLPLAAFFWRPAAVIAFGAIVIAAWAYKIITMHGA